MRSHRMVTLLTVFAALVLLACVGLPGNPGSDRSPGSNPFEGGLGGDRRMPSRDEVDRTVRSALRDIERFWATTYPAISGGGEFSPLRGGFHAYNRRNPPPACGPERLPYQPNAFYCPIGDFIAWDEEVLIPKLYADYGPFLVAVVMAHEYGHAIQARLDRLNEPTIVLEQQADCFAGSWISDIDAGRSTAFPQINPDDLDSTVAGMLFIRDQPGTSATSAQAHGNAFDRVRALQEGFEQGAAHCARYRANNLPVTEVPFSTMEEAASGGNLPYSEAVRLLAEDLQTYWSQVFPRLGGGTWEPLRVVRFDPADPPACAGRTRSRQDADGAAFYCREDDFVAFDTVTLGPQLYEEIGDNAIGTLLANLFAQAVLDRRGQQTAGRDGQLTMDCYSGSWTNTLLRRRPGEGLALSPGDLDEGVATLLVIDRANDTGGLSAFERIAAYREGTLRGLAACGR